MPAILPATLPVIWILSVVWLINGPRYGQVFAHPVFYHAAFLMLQLYYMRQCEEIRKKAGNAGKMLPAQKVKKNAHVEIFPVPRQLPAASQNRWDLPFMGVPKALSLVENLFKGHLGG